MATDEHPEQSYLMTIAEAAALLRVPVSWVHARTRLNQMPAMRRLGKYIRIDREELLRWVEQQGKGHGDGA